MLVQHLVEHSEAYSEACVAQMAYLGPCVKAIQGLVLPDPNFSERSEGIAENTFHFTSLYRTLCKIHVTFFVAVHCKVMSESHSCVGYAEPCMGYEGP